QVEAGDVGRRVADQQLEDVGRVVDQVNVKLRVEPRSRLDVELVQVVVEGEAAGLDRASLGRQVQRAEGGLPDVERRSGGGERDGALGRGSGRVEELADRLDLRERLLQLARPGVDRGEETFERVPVLAGVGGELDQVQVSDRQDGDRPGEQQVRQLLDRPE